MKEDKSKVRPMMEPESSDPYVFDTTTQEFVRLECEDCGATENLIESGGQFCGGTWYVCAECDDKGKKFQEWMKSPEFLENLKRIEKKGECMKVIQTQERSHEGLNCIKL